MAAFALSTTFDFNDACLAELAADEDMLPALEEVAQQIADVGMSYAPRHLANTIGLLGSEVDEQGAVVYVGTADSFAHLWEFGSVNTETYGFMRAAGAAVGDSFDVS
jgi:hypothetical protein